jgi:hypothetical protein
MMKPPAYRGDGGAGEGGWGASSTVVSRVPLPRLAQSGPSAASLTQPATQTPRARFAESCWSDRPPAAISLSAVTRAMPGDSGRRGLMCRMPSTPLGCHSGPVHPSLPAPSLTQRQSQPGPAHLERDQLVEASRIRCLRRCAGAKGMDMSGRESGMP